MWPEAGKKRFCLGGNLVETRKRVTGEVCVKVNEDAGTRDERRNIKRGVGTFQDGASGLVDRSLKNELKYSSVFSKKAPVPPSHDSLHTTHTHTRPQKWEKGLASINRIQSSGSEDAGSPFSAPSNSDFQDHRRVGMIGDGGLN